MNPIRRAWEWLYPPKLRCKAGGMAWIRSLDDGTGESALNGRAVRTVSLIRRGVWLIEPKQEYTATASAHYTGQDVFVWRGQRVVVNGVADAALEPWKEDGVSDSEVRDLYEPGLAFRPTKERA